MKQTTIILGPTKSGKTLLAKKLSRGLKCKWLMESDAYKRRLIGEENELIVIDGASNLRDIKSLINEPTGPDWVITSNVFTAKDFEKRPGLQVINLTL
ncbi:MAG: hypothetical protein K1X68_01340 [Saprospiraceae bacterium]|nr:hypothetical protein [Saprospiraceae bacterium]HMW39894.1 hypothetical protein [Saprospiraceae bacterium]HMX89141.1 hypothetical protein [Saprospiraceae bacterium]HMZ40798.1 hypothetical protein [Saprospiraceae bacterium]HNA64592.1 hypothetical protein [Saprospiraceae bacterium]